MSESVPEQPQPELPEPIFGGGALLGPEDGLGLMSGPGHHWPGAGDVLEEMFHHPGHHPQAPEEHGQDTEYWPPGSDDAQPEQPPWDEQPSDDGDLP